MLEPVGGKRLPDAHAQLTAVAQRLEDIERPQPAVLVVDRGDPAGVRDAHALRRGLDELVQRRPGVAVAKQPGRALAHDPGRLAALVAFDHAARHVELVRLRERGAVEPERVVVARRQRHRSLADDAIERPAGRRLAPLAVAPAQTAQPALAGRGGRDFARAPSSERTPSRRTWRRPSAQVESARARRRSPAARSGPAGRARGRRGERRRRSRRRGSSASGRSPPARDPWCGSAATQDKVHTPTVPGTCRNGAVPSARAAGAAR